MHSVFLLTFSWKKMSFLLIHLDFGTFHIYLMFSVQSNLISKKKKRAWFESLINEGVHTGQRSK